MDQVERNLDVRLDERDRLGEQLGDRDVNTQRVSEAETEKEVSALMQEYDLGLSDREYDRSPPKLELASEYRHPFQLLPPTMDISSVRFGSVPVTAQAEMTSTYGHPRLNWPEMAKVNISTRSVGFDVC